MPLIYAIILIVSFLFYCIFAVKVVIIISVYKVLIYVQNTYTFSSYSAKICTVDTNYNCHSPIQYIHARSA